MQIKQDNDGDGDFVGNEANEHGIILRAMIGRPTISTDQSFGEILTIQLTGFEYAFKEILSSEWHLFKSPKDSFDRRLLFDVNQINTPILVDTINTNLPDSPVLSSKPSAPTSVHDLISDVIEQLSLPDVDGGEFDDYYFDCNPNVGYTRTYSIIAEKFGSQDSGVILDPLSLSVADTQEENTVVTDNMEYKNNVIVVGTSNDGSLPIERTRFASAFEHARIRDEWDTTLSYVVGDLVQFIISTGTGYKPDLVTYHKCIANTTPATSDPIVASGTFWMQDFTTIPPYVTVSGAHYKRGEIVTHTYIGQTFFYQAIATGLLGTPPNSAGDSSWTRITSVPTDQYTAFVSYTPWTSDVDIWKQTLAGRKTRTDSGVSVTPSGTNIAISGAENPYAGWAYDWNVTKANYNRRNLTNHYEPVSGKAVNGKLSAPPTGIDLYDTTRWLVSDTPSSIWLSQLGTNKIAEYDSKSSNSSAPSWKYSDTPIVSDTIVNLEMAEIQSYAGLGVWNTTWSGLQDATTDRPSPFHLCKSVGLVAGATGIAGQAVEFTYDWFVNPIDPLPSKTHLNRTSRGVWISGSFPLPRFDTSQFNTGELYGGDGITAPVMGTFDTNNYDRSHTGVRGWNQGISCEDMGRTSALVCKLRVSMYGDRAGNDLVEGIPEIPMTFWCADKFDRVWYFKFTLRRNGQWDKVTIPIGELARSQLHFGRFDELVKINGVVMTEWDFTLQEKEYSGIAFDWREMKYWGFQLDESYSAGLYKNGHQRAFDYGEDVMSDLSANWYWLFLPPLVSYGIRSVIGKDTPVTQNHTRLLAKIAMDDLHFEKEQVCTSDDSPIVDVRTTIESVPVEGDYLNLKKKAKARQARKKFFPQIWHVRSTGDVRLRFGKRFTVLGSRVPYQASDPQYPTYNAGTTYSIGQFVKSGNYVYQSRTNGNIGNSVSNLTYWENMNSLVASEVKHIYDHDGYHCETAGFRKFVVSG